MKDKIVFVAQAFKPGFATRHLISAAPSGANRFLSVAPKGAPSLVRRRVPGRKRPGYTKMIVEPPASRATFVRVFEILSRGVKRPKVGASLSVLEIAKRLPT